MFILLTFRGDYPRFSLWECYGNLYGSSSIYPCFLSSYSSSPLFYLLKKRAKIARCSPTWRQTMVLNFGFNLQDMLNLDIVKISRSNIKVMLLRFQGFDNENRRRPTAGVLWNEHLPHQRPPPLRKSQTILGISFYSPELHQHTR